MKKLFLALSICLTATSVFANNYPGFRQLPNGRGTVKLMSRPDLNNKGSSLIISGPAAQVLFDKMSNDLLQSVDASERANGKRLVWKSGKNLYCSMEMEIKGDNTYECAIEIQDNSTGLIAEPGVG